MPHFCFVLLGERPQAFSFHLSAFESPFCPAVPEYLPVAEYDLQHLWFDPELHPSHGEFVVPQWLLFVPVEALLAVLPLVFKDLAILSLFQQALHQPHQDRLKEPF